MIQDGFMYVSVLTAFAALMVGIEKRFKANGFLSLFQVLYLFI